MLTTIICTTALAFETIICNCDNPSAKEHLQTNDENGPSLLKPTQKEVDYMLWTNRKAGIKFQASICGRWMKINHITTDFFGQQTIVPDTVALETSLTECTIMAKTKRCNDVQMKLTADKWTYTPDPSTIGSWFSTVSPYVINCMMEETRLIRQAQMTSSKLLLEKQILVSSGEGTLNKTSTPGTFHLEDEKQQLAFHIKPEGRCLITACRHQNESFTVIRDEHLFILIPHVDDDSKESDYEPPQRETTILSNTNKNNTVTSLEQILNTEIGLAAHVQFVRDKLTEQENDILRIVRNNQCELVRTKRALAISAAQYDGWLAASNLQFPECMNLQAQGETVLLKQCRAIRIRFATETTSCRPQPRFKKFIIATNGWEFAPYSPCYCMDHYVNFNGRHRVYRKADLAAAMAEQSMKTGINSSTAMRNIIVTTEENTGITSYMSWWKTFKIIMSFIGLAIICAIAFKILR
ncbi:Uncharacterized protein APZ42_030058 [Daphnia magna]|uniref:Uncharacterized protein n=1 Tax=Daphnia magna TaxID=35525 RepID=A0A162D3M2_9CRUS|nr:Uncharacterized protein APZ42_030058 [Daphnia magna]